MRDVVAARRLVLPRVVVSAAAAGAAAAAAGVRMQAQFDLLGVGREATDAELGSAYRKRALMVHPDKPGGDEEAFKELTAAFEACMRSRGNQHFKVNFVDLWANAEEDELTTQADRMRKVCAQGNAARVQQLLSAGADCSATDRMGLTALMSACIAGHALCAELLLSYGAAIDQVTPAGVTALMEACTMGREEVVQLLLEHGAAPDHRNSNGQTALMFACAHGREACARVLCDHGASKTVVDADGRAAADFARRRNFMELAAWLVPPALGEAGLEEAEGELRERVPRGDERAVLDEEGLGVSEGLVGREG